MKFYFYCEKDTLAYYNAGVVVVTGAVEGLACVAGSRNKAMFPN
jgi:hypothetical protein